MDKDIKYILKEAGVRIKRNGLSEEALIDDASNNITYYADKYIMSTNSINTGDIIEFENNNYIIISEIAGELGNYKARIRRSNFNIKFNFEGEIKEFPVIIEFLRYRLDSNSYITLNKDTLEAIIPNHSDSSLVSIDQRFIKMGSAWKIISIDKTKPGLLIMTCEKDLFNEYDDVDNEIADRLRYESNEPMEPTEDITYEIIGASSVNWGSTEEYSVVKKLEGNIVDADFTFSVSDSGKSDYYILSTIDNDTCSIQNNNKGYVNITLKAIDNDTNEYIEKLIDIKNLF